MPDSKITALTALTAADPANDMFPVVDVSDTTMAASGTTKRISINNILACSPSATLASATITGDLTVDTSTLKVDSANNRVGILTASPAYAFDVAGLGNFSQLRVSAAAATSLALVNTTSGLTYTLYSANTASNGFNGFGILDGSAYVLRINSNGALVLSGGTVSASGVGVSFPATQVASSDANTLDDYEEGTWVGTLKGSVSDPTIPVTATGAYTKVGRLVTATIGYSNVLTTGASGNVTIAGLPFAGAASSAGSVITFDMFTTSTTLACWNTGTTIAFYVSGGFIPATHNAGASRSVTVTITYHV